MKKLFLLAVICIGAYQSNAQFNYNFSDDRIPVVGTQYGIVGGGHSALLLNRDDIDAELITPQTMNFTYFGGAERIRWYTPHFGFGQQALYWNAGAAYEGKFLDTDDSPTISAKTLLTYAKVPLLFYYKSYSRWHPERRIRVNTFFGPYAAMIIDGKEEFNVQVPGTDINDTYTLQAGSYKGVNKDGIEIFDGLADDKVPFKIFDWGLTMGAGLEFRLWRKTVIALTVRTDLGMTEVENKDFKVQDVLGRRYAFYDHVPSKFQSPVFDFDGNNVDVNRPETRNMSFGAQLSIRKYFGVK